MRKVVVTGGAGFIGSHLTEELVKQGYHMVVLDNISTGKTENIEPLLNKENVEFVHGSIANLSLLQGLFQDTAHVFHQAAIPSAPRSIESPEASHEVNIPGTLNVLLAARDCNVKKVVYASSSSVYGDTPTLPKREDTPPNPQSPYAVTKLAGEYYCHVFQQVYALSAVCLRYFNVYGPRQDPDSQYAAVIPLFITRALQGKPPTIYGDGEQARDFTFVKDVIKANILAAESDTSGVFNIGRGENGTINNLTKTIASVMGKDLRPEYQPPRPGDVKHSLADISRARAIGFEPQYSLDRGLRETIRSFQRDTQLG